MANPFQVAGADKTKPTPYAPIYINEFFTGLWTNRNPLRDAAVPYLYSKFYSANRFDSLYGGSNGELTSRLTPRKRPGHSLYNNAGALQNYSRLYEWRTSNALGQQGIRIIGDGPAGVDDVTVPALGGNFLKRLFTKSAGAGKSQFQSVGNVLYFGDGVEQKKSIYAPAWQATPRSSRWI